MCAVHNKAFCSSGSHLSISGKSANSTNILSKESFAASLNKEVMETKTCDIPYQNVGLKETSLEDKLIGSKSEYEFSFTSNV